MGDGKKGNRIVAWLRMRLTFQLPQIAEDRSDLNTMVYSTIRELCCPDGRPRALVPVWTSLGRMETRVSRDWKQLCLFCNPNRQNRALNRG